VPEAVRADSVKMTRISSRTGFSTGSNPEIFKMTLSKIITPSKFESKQSLRIFWASARYKQKIKKES
jgi:hypothetical protein